MKRLSIAGLGLIAALMLPVGGAPLLSRVFDAGKTNATNVASQPKIELQLSVERQRMTPDASGKPQVVWQPLNQDKESVQPGDVLRYQITGINQGKGAAKNLIITQPLPQRMVYLLASAKTAQPSGNGTITYSIDQGKTFVSQPTVQVTLADGSVETQPAPPEMYSHIRWRADEAIAAGAKVNLAYQVKVR